MTEKEKVAMTFMDHVRELLYRLRAMLIAIIISTVVAMLVPVTLDFSNVTAENPFYATIASNVIRHLQDRFKPPEAKLLPLDPIAPAESYFFISIILGIVISSPAIFYELYKFINPALHKHERGDATKFVGAFVSLFLFGLFMGYIYIVPMTMRMLFMFANLLNLPPEYEFSTFFSTIGLSLLLCGLIFTFPIYIVLLVKVGILKTQYITKNRKYLYGGLIIVIAIVDPEPGIITESLVFLPLLVLTEISILIAKRIEKKREASQ